MGRVVSLREFAQSLKPKMKRYGSCAVNNIYLTIGKTGAVYYTFDLIDKAGKDRKINVKALRG